MQVVTKYEIGHRYWVPRCTRKQHEETMEQDGKFWVHEYFTYEVQSKQKEIIAIEISVNRNGTVAVKYGTINVGREPSLSQWYPEDNIENYTELEALKVAHKYAKDHQEYYGNPVW